MLQDGARVRLSGNGGDEILKSVPDPSPELADLFAERRLWQLHNQICAWGKDRKQPYLKLLWHAGLLPAFPRRLQIAFGRGPMSRLPDWFEPGFVRRTNLRELMLGPTDPFGFMLPSARMQACSFLSAVREISAGYLRMLQNVDIRFPLLHRPLVEFMQAIPSNQRLRLHETRSLQRRALRDLVPAEVLNRRSKGNPAEAIFRAVRREYVRLAPLFEDAYVARYGYVQQKALSAGLLRFVHGDQGAVWIPRIIQLEFWLRSLDRQREPFKINTAVSGSPVAQPTAV
jgi:asparagine synthase (glutamine-hydrolysing)